MKRFKPVWFIFLGLFAQAMPAPSAPVLPGKKASGAVLLPNGWKIQPAGKQVAVGVGPLGMALSPSGQYLAVLNCGVPAHSVMLLDAANGAVADEKRIPRGWVGLCWHPQGDRLFVSGASDDAVRVSRLEGGKLLPAADISLKREGVTAPQFVGQLALSPDGRRLYAALMKGNGVAVADTQTGSLLRHIPVAGAPYGVAVSPDGRTLAVSRWGDSSVKLISLPEGSQERHTTKTGSHPNEMAFSSDGSRLFVTCANRNTVTVIDLIARKAAEQINVAVSPLRAGRKPGGRDDPGGMVSGCHPDRR
ncbi:MAG: beta-propeller fold lactonase family protein [Armatimonadetes bacterium]|nr:beta-propeller fold lactonase family protein [Armatimonadota bacterium]